jgi:hypothetical protein
LTSDIPRLIYAVALRQAKISLIFSWFCEIIDFVLYFLSTLLSVADRFFDAPRPFEREMPISSKSVDPLLGMQALIAAAMRGGMREDQVMDVTSAIGLAPVAPPSRLSGSFLQSDYGEAPGRSGLSSLARFAAAAVASSPPRNDRPPKRNIGRQRSSRPSEKPANPDSKSVVVRNLPYSYDWQDLVRCFSAVANVRTAEVRMDDNKRSKGFGFVHFFSADDARKAVQAMNGVRFDGRGITVEQC